MDDAFDQALKTGLLNQQTIQLFLNWCTHANIERDPAWGVGLYEVNTGLPISGRRIRCVHAQHPSIAAMNMERVALDFHDKNCKGCQHRVPKNIPNFSEVLEKRDGLEQRRMKEETARDAEASQALAARNKHRTELTKSVSSTVQAGIEIIGKFDLNPSDENGAHMVETIQAVGHGHEPLKMALHAIVDSGGELSAAYALEALRICGVDTRAMVDAACVALGKRQALNVASQIVADFLSTEISTDLVGGALFGLVARAVPPMFAFSAREDPSRLNGLRAALSLFPEVCVEHFQRSLASMHHHVRQEALESIKAFDTQFPTLLTKLTPAIVRSLRLPDDEFRTQGATGTATTVLAYAMAVDPESTHAQIQEGYANLSDELQGHLVKVYALAYVLGLGSGAEHLMALCLSTVFEIAMRRRYDEAFEESIRTLGMVARKGSMPQTAAQQLFGLLVLMDSDYDEQDPSPLDLRPTALQTLDLMHRKSVISFGINHIIETIQASKVPNILEQIEKTMAGVPARRWRLRGYLVLTAKGAQRSVGNRAMIPFVYRGMMHAEQFVRKSSISLYKDLCRSLPVDSLPDRLHQCFVILVGDPFVMVHKEALGALGDIRLPDAYASQIFEHVWSWANVYSTGEADGKVAFSCIYVIHRMIRSNAIRVNPEKAYRQMLNWAIRLPPNDSYPVLRRLFEEFLKLGQPLTEAIFDMLTDPRLSSHHRRSICEAFHRVTTHGMSGSRIWSWLEKFLQQEPYPYTVFVIAENLTRSGHWDITAKLLEHSSRNFRGDSSDREAKRAIDELARFVRAEQLVLSGDISEAGLAFSEILEELVEPGEGSLAKSDSNMPQDFRPRGFMITVRPSATYRVRAENYVRTERIIRDLRRGEWATVADTGPNEFAARFLKEVGHSFSSYAYKLWLSLIEISGLLLKWAGEVRRARDGSHFRQAAHMRLDELNLEGNSEWDVGQFVDVVSRMRGVAMPLEIIDVTHALLSIPLPVPLYSFSVDREGAVTSRTENSLVARRVAIISFTVNAQPVTCPMTVQPDALHDLAIDIALSGWPEGATDLVLEPLGVAPVDTWTLPQFSVKNSGDVNLRATGNMRFHVPQSFGAEPLQFEYSGYFVSPSGQIPVAVEGARELLFRSYDPALTPVTGYEQVDLKLMAILDQIRMVPGVGMRELSSFAEAMKTIAQAAARSLQDGIFKDCRGEASFQSAMRKCMRDNPRIGSQLEEHPWAAGGGIVDLSFNRVRIELKYEGSCTVNVEGALRYSGQAAQYVSGSDRRLGILCVLDNAPSDSAAGSVQNDIFLETVYPKSGGSVPLLLGVVIIRGALPKPSSLKKAAKKKVAKKKVAKKKVAKKKVAKKKAGKKS
ncbi:hypothetical protein [Enhygromyxa salina]|uniref:Uncharacterized protein n=1 Tax=Enhygromyxa salina TaxID=215803 RepID=A0A2S9YAA0_9BACT|nr:hypothetical protein [Enhygromyxa salina]PRQ02040.1 hypothetical protein ENSA7_56130 [Enhygromyxa salina]